MRRTRRRRAVVPELPGTQPDDAVEPIAAEAEPELPPDHVPPVTVEPVEDFDAGGPVVTFPAEAAGFESPFEQVAAMYTRRCCPAASRSRRPNARLARVDAELLDDLLNNAGEVSIFRARIEQQMTSIEFNLAELDRTVTRLREQLRKLELETEAQSCIATRATRPCIAPTSTRSNSTVIPRSSSSHARSPNRSATWPASRACSRT